jgi:hypothetical protein
MQSNLSRGANNMKRIVDYLAEELKQAEPVIDFLAEELKREEPKQQRSVLKAKGAAAGR